MPWCFLISYLQNLKRQQKQGAKLTLDSLTSQDAEAPSVSTDGQVEASTEDGGDQEKSQSVTSDQEKPVEEVEEEEMSEKDISSNINRYSALTEGQVDTNMPVDQDGGEEEDDVNTWLHEEAELADGVKALSLQGPSEDSLEVGQEEKAEGKAGVFHHVFFFMLKFYVKIKHCDTFRILSQ